MVARLMSGCSTHTASANCSAVTWSELWSRASTTALRSTVILLPEFRMTVMASFTRSDDTRGIVAVDLIPAAQPLCSPSRVPIPSVARAVPGPSTEAGGSASGDGPHDRECLPARHRRRQPVEKPDVFVGQEDVDEPAQASVGVEDPVGKAVMGAIERLEHFADRGTFDGDLAGATGERAQLGGNSDVDAHDLL